MKQQMINPELIDQLKAVYDFSSKKVDFITAKDIIKNLITYVPGYNVSFSTIVDGKITEEEPNVSYHEMETAFAITTTEYAQNNINAGIELSVEKVDELLKEVKSAFKEVTKRALNIEEMKDKEVIYIDPWRNSFGQQKFYIKKMYKFTSKIDDVVSQ